MRRFVPVLLVIAALLPMCKPAPERGDIESKIVDVGTFTLGPGKPSTRESHFTEQGTVFTARLGLRFGFRFMMRNVPGGNSIDLKTTVTHPPITDAHGKTTTHYELITTLPVTNGMASAVTGYSFDRPEEMTPGIWTFTHSYRGKTVVTQSFMIR